MSNNTQEKVRTTAGSDQAQETPSKDTAAQLVSFEEIMAITELPKREMQWPGLPGRKLVVRAFTRKQAEDIRRECLVDGPDGDKVADRDLAERLTFMRGIVQPTLTKAEVDRIFLTQPTWAIQKILDEINKVNAAGGGQSE